MPGTDNIHRLPTAAAPRAIPPRRLTEAQGPVPDQVLRDVADGREFPNMTRTRAMAEELLAYRARDGFIDQRSTAIARFDIILHALTRCFRITGARGDVWHVASVIAAVLDEAQSAHAGIRAFHVETVLQHLHDDPTRMLWLDTLDGEQVLRGLRGVGAPE